MKPKGRSVLGAAMRRYGRTTPPKDLRLPGVIFMFAGLLVVLGANRIIVPFLAWVVGIENIVGKGNVIVHANGSFDFTNFQGRVAYLGWICGSMIVGVSMILAGFDMTNEKGDPSA